MTERSWAPSESGALALAVPARRAPLSPQVRIPAQRQPPPAPLRPSVEPLRSWAPQPHELGGPPRRRAAVPAVRTLQVRRLGGWVVNLLLLVVLTGFLGLAVGPHTGLYRTTTMLTGSMRPHYPPGAVLVLSPQPVSELGPGQVITFHAPLEDRRVVTHRVVSVDRTGGRPIIVTKGDANPGNDPWAATLTDDTVWQVRGAVPHLGSVIQVLRTPRAQLVLTRGLPAILLLGLLLAVWRPERPHA